MAIITHNRPVLGTGNFTNLNNQNFINQIFELPQDPGAGTIPPTQGQVRGGRQYLNCNQLYFENCVIDTESAMGMAFANCSNIHFKNCEFIGSGQYATCLAFLTKTNNSTFENCSFTNLSATLQSTAMSLLTISAGENSNWNVDTFENQFRFFNGFNGSGNFLAIPNSRNRYFLGANSSRVTFTVSMQYWEAEWPWSGEFVVNVDWYRNTGFTTYFIWDGLPTEVTGTLVSMSVSGQPGQAGQFATFTFDLPVAPPNNVRVTWIMLRENRRTFNHSIINCTFTGGIAGFSSYYARLVRLINCTGRDSDDYGMGFEYTDDSIIRNCINYGNAGNQAETVGRCMNISIENCLRDLTGEDPAALIVQHHTCHSNGIRSNSNRIQIWDWLVPGNMIPLRNVTSRGVNIATNFSGGSGLIT